MIRESFKTGLSFGVTSGIITTLGLIVGLHSGTHSRLAVNGVRRAMARAGYDFSVFEAKGD